MHSQSNLRTVATWLARNEIWFLGVFALPLLFPRGPWPWISLVFIAGLWLARYLSTGRLSRVTGLETPIAILLIMAGIGYSISLEPAVSAPRFWSILLGVLFFYGFVNWLSYAPARLRQAAFLLGLLTLAILVASLVGTDWHNAHMLAVPWLYDHLPTWLRNLPTSGRQAGNELFNPRWVGITLAFLAPVFLAVFFFVKEPRLKGFSGVVGLLSAGMVFLTQSIQGVLGLAAGLIFLIAWRWRWTIYLFAGAALLVVIALALVSVTLDGRGLAVHLLSTDNWAGIAIALRLDIWSRALAMLSDMPYTGIGLNMFPTILSHFYPGYLLGPEAHAHNLYLQTALDLGVPGLLAFVWLMVAWGVSVRRNYRALSLILQPDGRSNESQILLAGLAAGAIAYLAHGVMDALMLGAKPSVALWILLAMGAAPVHQPPDASLEASPSAAQRPPHRQSWIMAGVLLSAGLISLLLWPSGWRMNLGAIHAHQALYRAETTNLLDAGLMQRAQANLQQAVKSAPRLFAYDLLGRLAAWQGDNATAYGYFSLRVIQDSAKPWQRYYPPRAMINQLENHPTGPAENQQVLFEIYSQWLTRYPQRAENYLLAGLVAHLLIDNPNQAAQIYQNGIHRQAQPDGLLPYALVNITP